MSWWHYKTGIGIALAKHCNLVFCSFVLRIDWWKHFLTDHAITCGANGLYSFMCLWCNITIVAIRRKVRFHHTLPFMTKQRCSSVAATSRQHQKCHFWYFNMTSDVMVSDKFLMSDVLATNLRCCFFPHFLSFQDENRLDSWFSSFFHQSLTLISGVTRGLTLGGKLSWNGPLAKTQKKVKKDSESLDVVDVCTRLKNENTSKNAKKQPKEY